MTSIQQIKEEQHDEESELLTELINTKLEALWAELNVLRRSLRHVTDDEGLGLAMGTFFAFTSGLAIENGETKEEFLRLMGEAFDEMSAAVVGEEPGEEDTDAKADPEQLS